MDKVVVDLQIPREANVLTCYVGLSRVRQRGDILIYRPFDVSVFRKGPPSGPTVLLQHLRGEDIDWEAVKNRYYPELRRCRGECGEKLDKIFL